MDMNKKTYFAICVAFAAAALNAGIQITSPQEGETVDVQVSLSSPLSMEAGAVVKKEGVTKEGINAAMKAAANESFGYNEDEIVSSDIIGSRFGSIFDATQTMVSKIDDETFQVQVVSWYDNENSYTSQMVRTIKHFSNLL